LSEFYDIYLLRRGVIDGKKSAHGRPAGCPWAQSAQQNRKERSAHGRSAELSTGQKAPMGSRLPMGAFFAQQEKRPWAAPSKKLLHDARCQCHVIEYSPPVSKNERRGRCGDNFYLLRRQLWRSMLFGNVVHRVNSPPNRQGDDAMLRPQLHYSSRWFAQLCSLRCASMWDLSRR